MNYLVILDDGHGMETQGKRTPIFKDGTFMHENEFNNAVVMKIYENIKNLPNIDVFLTTTEKYDVPLKLRVNRANQAWADHQYYYGKNNSRCILVSVHANAYGDGVTFNNAKGVETYCCSTPAEERKLADAVHKYLKQGTEQFDRGVNFANFTILTGKMTSCLVECAFMTNIDEANLLRTDKFRDECADEISDGILEYCGMKPKFTTQTKVNKTVISSPVQPSVSNASSPQKSDNYEIYVVKRGDSLGKIASKYGVSYIDIAKLNNISAPYIINPDARLKIPTKNTPTKTTTQQQTTKVSSSDIQYSCVNGVHRLTGTPKQIGCQVYAPTGKANNTIKLSNAVNGTFFGGNPMYSTSPLIANGKIERWGSNYNKPQDCFIIYKDGTVEMRKLNSVSELGNKLYSVQNLFGGIGIKNTQDPDFEYNAFIQGFGTSVTYYTYKTLVAYNVKTSKISLISTPKMSHKTASTRDIDLVSYFANTDDDIVICLDGGGSVFMNHDGVQVVKGSGRAIHNAIYFN